VYLQFDGVSEEKNKHRGLGNYMEVKLRALENIAAAGMQTTLQVTVVNGLNNDCVGEIVRFALRNADQIHGVNFSARHVHRRDERISTEDGMQNGILSLNSLTTCKPKPRSTGRPMRIVPSFGVRDLQAI